MSQATSCPECGAELPSGSLDGLCPKCLLAAGLESRDDENRSEGSGSAVPTTPHSGIFVPLEPAELAAYFPQLEILELLGHGGMGAVYKARQPRLDRVVALKIIRPESADTPAFAERFNREAKTLARLSHPQIVAVYDFGEVNIPDAAASGQPRAVYYFIMEYVDGANLRQLMSAGELTPEQALAIVPQICEALQFAHNEGVVHRDIKPENILLDKRGRVKIADFGLAKLAAHTPEEFTLTGTHQVMGTPRYMAPEQMEGSHAVDHRADIYSLGVVFYEMLTGEVPMGHFEPPSKKVEIDVRLDEVVLRSLAREPERRYQHASDVKTDVESIAHTPRQIQATPSRGETVAEDAEIDAARQIVRFPAIGLIVIGGFTLIPCLFAALMLMAWVFKFVTAPWERAANLSSPSGLHFLTTVPVAFAFVAAPLAMIIGGVQMLRLTSYRWAMTASVMALLLIPAGRLWLLSLPLGIWSLAILFKPEVKRGFGVSGPIEQDAATRMLLPIGRSWYAIAAGYAGLLALIPFLAPIALILGVLAIRDIKRNPQRHGMVRAIFGLVMGLLGTLLLIGLLWGAHNESLEKSKSTSNNDTSEIESNRRANYPLRVPPSLSTAGHGIAAPRPENWIIGPKGLALTDGFARFGLELDATQTDEVNQIQRKGE
jgi:tRNA A-37 threonylcarbamoyl transferase component Bud32